MTQVCLIYNFPQHYREEVFSLIDQKLNIDFYFGDKMDDVKSFNPRRLRGFKGFLANKYILGNIYFQRGSLGVIFNSSYKKYIILGEFYCINHWLLLFSKHFYKKRKIYLWTHGFYGRENSFKYLVKRIFFSLSDGILLYGNYAKELMTSYGYRPEFMHVIYNSYKFTEIKKNLFSNKSLGSLVSENRNSKSRILFIGRLTSVKRLDILIMAICYMKNVLKYPVDLFIVGIGEDLSKLEKLVVEKELIENVHFLGALYDEELIAPIICSCDLCISPGNVGLTAIHCLSYGTPVATHNNFSSQMPEFEAILDTEFNGFLFEKDSYLSIAQKSVEYLTKINSLSLEEKLNIRYKRMKVISEKYNPTIQLKVIQSLVLE